MSKKKKSIKSPQRIPDEDLLQSELMILDLIAEIIVEYVMNSESDEDSSSTELTVD